MISKFSILNSNLWPSRDHKIILTFDDGPNIHNSVSENLLVTLSQHRVKATFCYIGKNIQQAPYLVRAAYKNGHQLAIHSHSHLFSTLFSASKLNKEIIETVKAMRIAISEPAYSPLYFRPPFGVITPTVYKSIKCNNLELAYLTFYVNDAYTGSGKWQSKIEKIKKQLKKHQGGAIVLHEMCYRQGQEDAIDKSWLPQAVDELITWGKAQGFEFDNYNTAKI